MLSPEFSSRIKRMRTIMQGEKLSDENTDPVKIQSNHNQIINAITAVTWPHSQEFALLLGTRHEAALNYLKIINLGISPVMYELDPEIIKNQAYFDILYKKLQNRTPQPVIEQLHGYVKGDLALLQTVEALESQVPRHQQDRFYQAIFQLLENSSLPAGDLTKHEAQIQAFFTEINIYSSFNFFLILVIFLRLNVTDLSQLIENHSFNYLKIQTLSEILLASSEHRQASKLQTLCQSTTQELFAVLADLKFETHGSAISNKLAFYSYAIGKLLCGAPERT